MTRRRRDSLVHSALVVVLGIVAATVPAVTPLAHAASASVLVSANPDRSSAAPLDGTTRGGSIYVFVGPQSGIYQVSFWLDDPSRTGAPTHVENTAPFDFKGGSSTAANPWDTTRVANGSHTITTEVVPTSGSTTLLSATFLVLNGSASPYAPQVSARADRSSPRPLAGATLSGSAAVFVPSVSGISKIAFYLDDTARARSPIQVESWAPYDFRGTATGGTANLWSTTSVSNGQHVISVDVTTASGVTRLDASFSVSNGVTGKPTQHAYSPIAKMPIGTTEAESVVVGGKLYLFGGFDVWKSCCTPTNRAWLYDPAAGTWTALPPMPTRGIDHAGIDSDGVRYIYYAGGYPADAAGTGQTFGTAAVWRYDIVSGTYAAMPSLPQPRSAGGLAYISGRLYYFGGSNLDRTVDAPDVWMLDVSGGATSWVSRAPMPDPRNHLGWSVLGGQLYVVGGQHFSDSTKAQGELDRYDPSSNTWTRLPSLPVPRSHVMDSTFVLDGRLVVAGGWTASAVSASVTAYDPVTNSWQTLTDLPEPRTSTTVRSISGGRYVFCDGSAGSSNATGWLAVPIA